jgi:hypothetical protein
MESQEIKKEITKRERTLIKFDVIALVFRPRAKAWSNKETVDTNTLLLVSSFKTSDKHSISTLIRI